ncbi:DUF1871 family protein [Evansella cellulosilytica]|nr:DUF1871 family protein [Evansella cellulosilytica]
MERSANNVVTKHVNNWDPELLLEMGAPDDEYEFEIERITKEISRCQDEIEVAEVIKDIFDDSFGRDFPLEECLEIAKKIWVNLHN